MTHTENFEELLALSNVIAVEYDDASDRVIAFVSQKLPEGELADEDIIEYQLPDHETDVQDAGYGEPREGFDPMVLPSTEAQPAGEAPACHEATSQAVDPMGDRATRHRPVPGGISEINHQSTAATGGAYPAYVRDPGAAPAEWADDVQSGDLVRISNCHVYARSGRADFGEPVLQPSPYDGGDEADEIGTLAAYLPLTDGVTVDAAARTVTPEQEYDTYHELDEELPRGIYRGQYEHLGGREVRKTGRTTGVSDGTLLASSASVRVHYGGDLGVVTLRDQLLTEAMTAGGDSGSPLFLATTGELLGHLYAGSARISAANKIARIEGALGVTMLPREPAFTATYGEAYRHLRQTVGGDVHVIPAETARRLLTDGRREILRALVDHQADPFDSITELAEHLGRQPTHVGDDLNKLAEADIVQLTSTGRRKLPTLRYDMVMIEPIVSVGTFETV